MLDLRKHLGEVQKKIGYYFINKGLLCQAFTRSSYSVQYGTQSNEVLEFIGDAVLDFVVVKILVKRFGLLRDEFRIINCKNEDDFTKLKQQIVSNNNLARQIDKLGFAKYMYLGDCDIKNGITNQEKVKADLFEAVLGAIAIDSDWNMVKLQNSIEKMLQIDRFFKGVDVQEVQQIDFNRENAINVLKELAEHGKCHIPEYILSDEQIYKDGRYSWECTCTIRNYLNTSGNKWIDWIKATKTITRTAYALNKKEAKKDAAYQVLCCMFGLPNEY